jgi:hypothetical protein
MDDLPAEALHDPGLGRDAGSVDLVVAGEIHEHVVAGRLSAARKDMLANEQYEELRIYPRTVGD